MFKVPMWCKDAGVSCSATPQAQIVQDPWKKNQRQEEHKPPLGQWFSSDMTPQDSEFLCKKNAVQVFINSSLL